MAEEGVESVGGRGFRKERASLGLFDFAPSRRLSRRVGVSPRGRRAGNGRQELDKFAGSALSRRDKFVDCGPEYEKTL